MKISTLKFIVVLIALSIINFVGINIFSSTPTFYENIIIYLILTSRLDGFKYNKKGEI